MLFRSAGVDVGAADFELGHALHDVEQRCFVDGVESFARLVGEEYLRCLDGAVVLLFAVDHAGDFLGEAFLQRALSGVGSLLADKVLNLLAREFGEYLDVFLGVAVADVEPELVELAF